MPVFDVSRGEGDSKRDPNGLTMTGHPLRSQRDKPTRPFIGSWLIRDTLGLKEIRSWSCSTLLRGAHFVRDEPLVLDWLDGLKAGDDADIARLWDRYFDKLVRLAGSRLPGHALRGYDAEDAAPVPSTAFAAAWAGAIIRTWRIATNSVLARHHRHA